MHHLGARVGAVMRAGIAALDDQVDKVPAPCGLLSGASAPAPA